MSVATTTTTIPEHLAGKKLTFFICSFDELALHIREPDVIAAARRCVYRIGRRSTEQYSSRRGPVVVGGPSKKVLHVNIRVFLCVFMIHYHPRNVFERDGELEEILSRAASALVHSFHAALASIRATNGTFVDNPEMPFMRVLVNYLDAYETWATPDKANLVTRMENGIVGLTLAEAHMPAEEPEDSPLRVNIRRDICRMKDKLAQIGGAQALAELEARLVVLMTT